MSKINTLLPDEIELDIPGGEPENSTLPKNLSAKLEKLALLDRAFGGLVAFAPPLGFLVALGLHASGWYNISPIEISIMLGMHFLCLVGIEVGFHRLFTHGSYQANKTLRVIFAILGSMAFQGPVIWWAAIHRNHHRHSDKTGDPHSPHLSGEGPWALMRGLFHAHMGWLFVNESVRAPGWSQYVQDLYRDENILKVHMAYFYWLLAGFAIPSMLEGLITWSWRGAFLGFLWGGLVRIFIMNHLTYWCINSVTHSIGNRPFRTTDRSTNNLLLAIPTLGQTWHNNHHAFPSSSMMGLEWWQIDIGGLILRLLEKLGLVWDLKVPTESMLASKRLSKISNTI
jgi:stearoyl-CoA desaturase (Delta-9 desaturase)